MTVSRLEMEGQVRKTGRPMKLSHPSPSPLCPSPQRAVGLGTDRPLMSLAGTEGPLCAMSHAESFPISLGGSLNTRGMNPFLLNICTLSISL